MELVSKDGLVALVYDVSVPLERERLMIRLNDHAQMGGHEGRRARHIKATLEADAKLKALIEDL